MKYLITYVYGGTELVQAEDMADAVFKTKGSTDEALSITRVPDVCYFKRNEQKEEKPI